MGGGPHGPPLGVISCHSVVDAPTNSKFLDFSQLHLLTKMVKIIFFSQILTFIVSKLYSVFFEVHYMSVSQKLTILKFVPEEAMQLKRLIKSSNESL